MARPGIHPETAGLCQSSVLTASAVSFPVTGQNLELGQVSPLRNRLLEWPHVVAFHELKAATSTGLDPTFHDNQLFGSQGSFRAGVGYCSAESRSLPARQSAAYGSSPVRRIWIHRPS